jgi:hypothetical protein
MVCWADADAEPVAADDAKDIRWMTLPQLRGVNVRIHKRRGGGRLCGGGGCRGSVTWVGWMGGGRRPCSILSDSDLEIRRDVH